MPTLSEIVAQDANRDQLVKQMSQVVTQFVNNKSGLSFIPIKMGFKALMNSKPDALDKGMSRLLPELCGALDSYYTGHAGKSFADFIDKSKDKIAQDLLDKTQARIEKSDNSTAKQVWGFFKGKQDGKEIATQLAKLVATHVDSVA